MAIIELDGVGLDFPVYNSVSRSLRFRIYQTLGGVLSPHNKVVVVQALDNVTLQVEEGDRLGLIGHNGAGKTTLLRVMSRIYHPTRGKIAVKGSIASFTNIYLGMDLESSGWDNIVMRSVFMGMSFREAKERRKEIGEFTELGQFLDLPVRTYSTGMFVRLAFAISTAVNADIIIMDEMIGAGDASFIQKAQQRLDSVLSATKAVVLASHNTAILRRTTTKLLWLEQGRTKAFGPTAEVLEAYGG